MTKQPYKYWTRDQFLRFLAPQAHVNGLLQYEKDLLVEAIFDNRWNPARDFNGCTLVQDDYHPSLSCFIHDYEWIVYGPSQESNRRFYKNLRKAGMSPAKARMWYIGVTIGTPIYKFKRYVKRKIHKSR